jgi:hypothetical protein
MSAPGQSADPQVRPYVLDPDDPADMAMLGQAIHEVMQRSYPGSPRVTATAKAMATSFAQPIARAYVDAKRSALER